MRLLILFSVFLNPLLLKAHDNRENVKFGSLIYPISSVSMVNDKTYILYETPVSDTINVKFNAVAVQGKVSDRNIRFELWVPKEIVRDGESYMDYSVIKGVSKIFPNGRFWVRFDIKSQIDSFKLVVINNGVKSDKFDIKIYEIQMLTIFTKRNADDISLNEDKSLSLPLDIPFKLIRRSEWNAKLPKENYIKHTPLKITLHHTAGHYPETYEDAMGEILFIQDYHQNARGWIDIGYHFLIDPLGNIFEGRPVLVVGAHVSNKNTNNVGISIMGNYHPPVNNEIKNSIVNSIITIASYLKNRYSIPKTEFYAHRDLGATDCPGDTLYFKIPELKKMIFNEHSRGLTVDVKLEGEEVKNQIYNQLINW